MRNITILAATLALTAGMALSAAPAAARDVLAVGQSWNMRQDLARMDAPARPPGFTAPLSLNEQRARRAAYQRSMARQYSGLAQRRR